MSTIHFNGAIESTLIAGKYEVLRKLGEGSTSTTWLVRDLTVTTVRGSDSLSFDKYSAAKIFSAEATAEPNGPSREREFLQVLADKHAQEDDDEGLDYLPSLVDSFTVDGKHFCLIMPLYSTSLSALRRSAPEKRLPLHVVRNTMYMTLRAVQTLHELNIVHTDVKSDNILFVDGCFTMTSTLENFLADNPVQTEIPESQPLPHLWIHDISAFEAEKMTVVLTSFGHAEWTTRKPSGMGLGPLSLRPPEVLLGAGFGPSIDIWAIGCLTFELLIGKCLFSPEDGGDDRSIEEDSHLAKIQELTGQRFTREYLSRASNRDRYFDQNGDLVRIPRLSPVLLEQAMSSYGFAELKEEEIKEVADFIRACLELDHEKRPSAAELIKHRFFKKTFQC